MDKKNYLSETEQDIWELINEKVHIDNELIRLIFPDHSQTYIRKILHSIWKKGYLKRAQRDVYYNPEHADYWELALKVQKGYLGLTSALRFHNLVEYEDVRIFVMTEKTYKKVILEEHEIVYLPLKNLYSGFQTYGKYAVSTPEKTIFDCFLKANLVGYSVITKALYDTKAFNWKGFISTFKESDNKSLHQRTGYILELMQSRIGFHVPRSAMTYFRSNTGAKVRLGNTKGKTIFQKEWNIQDDIGEERILGWWQ